MVFLILLFTLLPALEFYLLFKIGAELGAFSTFMLIILTGVVGATLAKLQGWGIYLKAQKEMAQGQIPANSLIHGLLVFAGGLLLLTPGFLTDFLGFAMVIPGTRHFFVMKAKQYFQKGLQTGSVRFFYSSHQAPKNHKADNNVIEAEYTTKD